MENNFYNSRTFVRWMRWVGLSLLLSAGMLNSASAQVTVTGCTGPGNGSYTTLGAAITAIGTAQPAANINISITASTTEGTGSITIGVGTWTSMLISPSGGAWTISAATTAGSPTIDLAGADNVTINGLNSGGNALTIQNTTASATSGTSTIRFINGATNNVITNCSIQGSFSAVTTTNGGNIFFSTDGLTANGNDNNTISNCDIGPAGANLPTKCIYMNGSTTTTTLYNSGNTFNNNNIHDFFGAAVASAGIYISTGNTDNNITNNRLYQSATRTQTAAAAHSGIQIASSTAGNNFQIIGNTIGYSSSAGTGTYTFVGFGASSVFIPINLAVASTTPTSVQGNTITNIAMSGTLSGTSSSASFRGIYVSAGLVNIGATSAGASGTGNTIGSQSATGAITITTTSASAYDAIGMFNFGSANWVVMNNTIGGITASSSSTGAANVYGIRLNTSSLASTTITNNTIGGTVANSMSSTTAATGSTVQGILLTTSAGTITGNTVRNLTAAGGTGTGSAASVIGIGVAGSSNNHTVSGNTIFNLSNTNAAAATWVNGLNFSSSTGANLVARNFIHSLSVANATAQVNGIYIVGGTATYQNNMIRLGIDGSGASVTAAALTTGINETTAGTDNIYFNSVYIGGTGVGTTANNSYAFRSTITTNTRSFRDNIFVNARSNASTGGKHYAVQVGGTTPNPAGLLIDYNVYQATGVGGVFGFFNSLDVASLPAWRTAVGQDVNSWDLNPQYLTPAGTSSTVDLHINPSVASIVEGKGLAIGSVTDDFDGQVRASFTPTDIGADAGNFTSVPTCSGTPTAGTITGASTVCLNSSTLLTLSGATTDINTVYQWGSSSTSGGPYTNMGTALTQSTGPVAATTYYIVTVTCTSVGGGTSTTSEFTINTNALPTVAVSPTSGTYCTPGGTAVALTASGATTYAWTPATGLNATTGVSVNASPSTATTYTVTGTDANGCTATAASVISTSPAVSMGSVTATPATICSNANSQLNASASVSAEASIYSFASTTGGTLDPMTGSTQIVASASDVVSSAVTNIGFTFRFGTTNYTQFSASCNGVMGLGAVAVTSADGNNSTTVPSIIPAWDDMHTGTDGKVHYILDATGGVGNRILKVEWRYRNFGESTPGTITKVVQVWLFESTNVIKFIYGANTGVALVSATVGIVSSAGQFNDVNTATGVNSTVAAQDANTVWPASGTVYTFTPPAVSSYSWSPATFLNNPAIANPLATAMTSSTTYTVTASTASCSATGTVSVTVGAALSSSITPASASICLGQSGTLTANPIGGGGPFTYSWTIPDGVNPPIVVGTNQTLVGTPSVTTTFTVTITDNCGSTTSSTVTVTVNPVPSISVTPTSGVVCGAPVTITASGTSDTYAWSPATGLNVATGTTVIANPAATTVYTVTGTITATGCTSTATSSITLGLPVSMGAVTATPSGVCNLGSSQLQATATSSGAVNSYSFSAGTGASLDAMTGSTQVLASSNDDTPMGAPGSIGFTFPFNGTTYTQFSASPDGWILLGSATAVSQFTNAITSTTNIPKISAYWDDLATGSTGNVKTLLTGSAPNRIFIIQWFVTIPRNTTGAANSTFQMWLYETSGKIEFRYGTMNTATSTSISAGLTGSATNFHSITFATGTSSTVTANDANAAATPASGTIYTYTPPTVSGYSWSPSTFLNNPAISNPLASLMTSTTTYTVTATGSTGCTATGTVTVSVGDPLVITAAATPATICSGHTSSLAASIVSGGGPFTYSWSDGTSTIGTTSPLVITPGATGTYTVTVTDACLGTQSATVTVTVIPSPVVAVTNSNPLLCGGAASSSLVASGTDTYAWSPATGLNATTGATVTATSLATTTYTVTGTATASGCTATATTTVTRGLPVTSISASASPSVICPGNDVNLTSSASGPALGTYTMSTITYGLQPTTGFTALGGGDDLDLATGVALPFTLNYFGTSQTTINFSSNGYVYFGTPNGGSILSGGVSNGINIFAADMLPAAGQITYGTVGTTPNRIFVVDYNAMPEFSGGGTHSGQIQIYENGKIEIHVTSASSTRVKTLGIKNAGATVTYLPAGFSSAAWTVSTPTAFRFQPDLAVITSYSWSPAFGLLNPAAQNTTAIAVFSSTVYTVTASEASGCTATATASVTVSSGVLAAAPVATPSSTCPGGTVSLASGYTGGCPPYTFNWSDGTGSIGTTDPLVITVPSAGTFTYTVTVTESGLATATGTVTVTVNAPPTVSVTNSAPGLCAPITSSTLTASGADTYVWSPSAGLNATTGASVIATPTTGTTYTVTGTTTATGCTATATTTVTPGVSFTSLTAAASPMNICVGGTSNLSATATFPTCTNYYAVAPTTYGLLPTTGFTNGPSGDDANTLVTMPFSINFYGGAATNQVDIVTNGYVVLGGSTSTAYTPQTIPSATVPNNLIAAFWCDLNVTLGQLTYGTVGTAPNRIFVVDYNAVPELSGGGTHSGQIQIFESGRIEVHVTSVNSTRTKTLGVEDATGATAMPATGRNNVAWQVSTPEAWAFTQCSSATVSSYSWSPSTFLNNPAIATPTASGVTTSTVYTVTVTNSTGCTATATASVVAGATLSATAAVSPALVCSGAPTTLTATVSGGGMPYTYDWSDGAASVGTTNPLAITPATSGIYTVTVTDNCGTTTTATVSVNLFPTPTVSISAPAGICTPGPVALTASGAATYLWSTTETTASINPTVSATTTYTVTGTSVDGCTASATATVVIPPASTVTATATPDNVCSGGTSQLNAVASYPPPSAPSYPAVTNAGSSCVTNVTLNTLNSLPPACLSPYYHINAPVGTETTTLMPGSTYTVGVTCGGTAIVSVWIDYNRNGVYEASEWVQPYTAASTGSATINVPSGASIGQTGMRVRSRLNGNQNGAGDALLSMGSGSTEDYTITIGVPISGTFTYSWTPATGLTNPSISNPVATMTATTLFTVTATDLYGCTSTGQVLVSVNPLFASSSASATTVCAGAPVTLSSTVTGGGAPYSYSWSDGAGVVGTTATLVVNPTVSTSYTLTVTDNCSTVYPVAPIAITVNPAPGASVTPATALYCAPAAVALSATSGDPLATFAWSPATGLNVTTGASVNASPAATTTYTVTATNAGGCTSTATASITVGTPITVTATADATEGCSPFGTVLHACANPVYNTYTVTSIPFAAHATPGSGVTTLAANNAAVTTMTSGTLDDGGWASLPIGFNFNFYGVAYSQFAVSTNGFVYMGPTPTTYTGYGNTFPSAFAANPCIAACYADLDWRTSGATSKIEYWMEGTAPNRKLVVNFVNGQFYLGVAGSIITTQVILSETTNKIEIHTTNVTNSTATNVRVQGIQNAGATASQVVTGRNGGTWQVAAGDAFELAPASVTCGNTGVTFAWTPSGNLDNPAITDPTVSGLAASTVYTVSATNASGCSATATSSITVHPQAPTPTITPSGPLSFCPGGSVTLTSSNNTFPNNWSTSETTQSITVSTTQLVTLIASDAFCPSAPVSVNVVRYDTIQPLITVAGGGATLCTGTRDLTSDGAPQYTAWAWSPTSETTQTITISSPGTYYLLATDLHGCPTHNEITISAGVAPPAPVISTSSPLTVCNNTSVTITSDINPVIGSLLWSPTFDVTPSVTYNLSPPGSYDFFVTYDSLGCTSESNHLVFTVNPTPDITSFSPAANGCVGDVITFTGSGFTGVTSVSFNGTAATVFTVVDDNTITATVPSGATSGAVTLVVGATGCTSVSSVFTINTACSVTLTLKAYLQGYYDVSVSAMRPVWTNHLRTDLGNGNPGTPTGTEADLVRVELYDASNTLAYADSMMLDINGNGSVSFPSAVNGNSYYIMIKHRCHIQTRSAGLVLMGALVSYDFTTASTQVDEVGTASYGGPMMVEVEPGKWAFFAGDITQDGFIGGDDVGPVDNDNLAGLTAFDSGYMTNDINGDGFLGGDDVGIVDNNNLAGVFYLYP